MSLSFPDVLARLQTGIGDRSHYVVGSAGIGDEDDWNRLGAQFDEARRTFTQTYGEPAKIKVSFPDAQVERVVCWEISGKILYALLSYLDNTRIRRLTLGVCSAHDLTIEPDAADWWSRPAW